MTVDIKKSVGAILNDTYMGQHQRRYEHRPTLCITLLTMCETYGAKFNVSYQTLLTNLVDVGLEQFIQKYTLFKDYTDKLGDHFDPTTYKDTSKYKYIGVQLAAMIEKEWPNVLSTRSNYRPRMYIREIYEPFYNRMCSLCNLESYILIKMFLSFAFTDTYEDTKTFKTVRDKTDKILIEVKKQ